MFTPQNGFCPFFPLQSRRPCFFQEISGIESGQPLPQTVVIHEDDHIKCSSNGIGYALSGNSYHFAERCSWQNPFNQIVKIEGQHIIHTVLDLVQQRMCFAYLPRVAKAITEGGNDNYRNPPLFN